MLKRLMLKLLLLTGLCLLALAPQSARADGCSQRCGEADDGWTICDWTTNYRSYCQITSHCDDCTPLPGQGCTPNCTNLCMGGGGC